MLKENSNQQLKNVQKNNYIIAKKWSPQKGIDIFLLKIDENINHINPNIIPCEQKIEISKYHHMNDRQKRLLARSFLFEYCLSMFELTDYTFNFNQFQKPFFKNSNIQFSFSYSKKYILVGLSIYQSIGVDIEYNDINISYEAIIQMAMHEKELLYFKGLLKKDKKKFLYDLWCMKEAYIKMTGKGLSHDIKKINIFSIQPDFNEDQLKSYFLYQYIDKYNHYSICFQFDQSTISLTDQIN
jgi:4'-phosphopantetheinyl transferase